MMIIKIEIIHHITFFICSIFIYFLKIYYYFLKCGMVFMGR